MLAFHGNSNTKANYVERVKAHAIADEIVHGTYWRNGKGCAIGCTIHGSDHSCYETELGIPRILARLEDRIFEGMRNGDSKEFPLRFLSAIEPGADLSLIWYQFAHWLLVDKTDGVLRFAKTDRTKEAIIGVASLFNRAQQGLTVEAIEWSDAKRKARAAAAAHAADAADADAAKTATKAAHADAYDSATAAAYAYAEAAATATAYPNSGTQSACSAAYGRQADKLIELLTAAPVPSKDAV